MQITIIDKFDNDNYAEVSLCAPCAANRIIITFTELSFMDVMQLSVAGIKSIVFYRDDSEPTVYEGYSKVVGITIGMFNRVNLTLEKEA